MMAPETKVRVRDSRVNLYLDHDSRICVSIYSNDLSPATFKFQTSFNFYNLITTHTPIEGAKSPINYRHWFPGWKGTDWAKSTCEPSSLNESILRFYPRFAQTEELLTKKIQYSHRFTHRDLVPHRIHFTLSPVFPTLMFRCVYI